MINKEIVIVYYHVLLHKNHLSWWLEDYPLEYLHRFEDQINDAYWGLFWKIRGFV